MKDLIAKIKEVAASPFAQKHAVADRLPTNKMSAAEWVAAWRVLDARTDFHLESFYEVMIETFGANKVAAWQRELMVQLVTPREYVRGTLPSVTKAEIKMLADNGLHIIPGANVREQAEWLALRLAEAIALAYDGTSVDVNARANALTAYALQRVIEAAEEPEPPAPAPVPTPEKPNKGGDGLYKPETSMWMLPLRDKAGRRVRAMDLISAGEFEDEACTKLVKWFVWPDKVGAVSGRPIDGNHRPVSDNANFYHPDINGRLKCRGAKADNSGSWFGARTLNGLVFTKQIKDRNTRQE